MNDQIKTEQISKKSAHILLIILDFLCILGLWLGYNDLIDVLTKAKNHVDTISFSNRLGFYILGIGLPLLHLIVIIEYFWPKFRRHKRTINSAVITMVFILFGTGIIVSSWIKSEVESAGYVYCRQASGISALAKTLVYTKNKDICEEIVASKRKERK